MTVYVTQRLNGDQCVEGTRILEIPKLRHYPAMVAVQFPGESLVEWFLPDQVSTTPLKRTVPTLVRFDFSKPQGDFFGR